MKMSAPVEGRRRGRPPGGIIDDLPPSVFLEKCRRLSAEHRREYRCRPRQEDLCSCLCISRVTLHRYLTAHALPWPPEFC